MDHIESLQWECHRVRLDELKGVVRLRFVIDTYDLEACAMIASSSSSCSAKEVK